MNALLLDIPPGQSAIGIYLGVKPLLDREGNPKVGQFGTEMQFFDLQDPVTKEIRSYWANGGFRGAVNLGNVESGMLVEVLNTGEFKEHPDYPGSKIAQFEIYLVEPAESRAPALN